MMTSNQIKMVNLVFQLKKSKKISYIYISRFLFPSFSWLFISISIRQWKLRMHVLQERNWQK